MPGHATDPRSDQQLVHDCDFDSLYWKYRDWVVRLAFRFTANEQDSLDVLQDTFMYLAQKLPTLELTASMKTFLYPAVRNLSLEARRKRRRFAGADEQTFGVISAPPVSSDHRADLAAVLSILPDAQREVLLMRFVDDLKLEEIAEALQIPLGTVKSRLHNALETLRRNERTRRYFER